MVEDLRTEVLSPTWCRWPSGQCYLEGIGSKGMVHLGDSPSLLRFGEGNAQKKWSGFMCGMSLGQAKSLGFYHCYGRLVNQEQNLCGSWNLTEKWYLKCHFCLKPQQVPTRSNLRKAEPLDCWDWGLDRGIPGLMILWEKTGTDMDGNFYKMSKKSPTGPTEWTPKPEYLIALATYLGVHW